MPVGIETQKSMIKALARLGFRTLAAQHGSDPKNQLPGAEGLGHVVIRAEFEPHHAIHLIRLGGEHDDRQACGLGIAAQSSTHLGAADIGEHQVEHHEIRPLPPDLLKSLTAVLGGFHVITRLGEIDSDELEEIRLVIDYEYAFSHDSPTLPITSARKHTSEPVLRKRGPIFSALSQSVPRGRIVSPDGRGRTVAGMYRGLILQPSYRIARGVPVVQLFGRLADGPAFLIEDDRFRPYFFVPAQDAERFAGVESASVAPSDLRGLDGSALARVATGLPGDVPALRDRATRSFESDIRFPYRFLIDRGVRAAVEIDGEPDPQDSALLRFSNPALRPADCRPPLRVLSIDLETSPDASEIYSIALVGDDANEVHLVSPREVSGAVVYADERSLLAAAAQRILELDPDILTGWNVVDFDLRTWDQRARSLGGALELGRVPGRVGFQEDLRFTRQSRAVIPGRMVLDGIPLVRDTTRLPDYRLETVARAVLGRGKLIDAEVPDAAAEIQRRWREDPEALVAYNREDAQLVLDILAHEGLLDLSVERSLLSGMQLDRVGASVASFDLLYLPELRARGRVAPGVDASRKATMLRGGAVLDSKPGLFSQVAVFDFKSLYPSLIRTFNLDPLAHACSQPGDIEAPNGAKFSREEAILPEIIARYMERREAAKARGDRNADQAIKIMMNALYGVLGAAGCRFFDPDVANAITGFGQQTLLWTREAFEDAGVSVIYGDTDSVFVQLHSMSDPAAEREAEQLRGAVEQRIEARIRADYGVEPRLVLELEKIFQRFFMPRVRGGGAGSKKRYAGLRGGSLEVVGLESVRRDWPAIAGSLQRGLLERVFADEDPLPFTREIIEAVRGGRSDDALIYTKRIRKGSVDSYTASAPPHVQAARKAGTTPGGVIHYVIAKSGPEPAIPGRPLPRDLDYGHYVEKVLRPVAEAILIHVGKDFDEAAGNPRQLSLL